MTDTIRRTGIMAAVSVTALAAAGGFSAGAAQAAPIGVQQVPATGIIAGGISDFGTRTAAVRIETSNRRGVVWLSAPGGGQCGHPAVQDSFVRFDYTNVSTGRVGSRMVRPCLGPWSGVRRVALDTGSGTVIGTINIVSGGGPWSLPGVAAFGVG